MSANPYVAEVQAPSWHSGMGLVDDVVSLSDDLQSGNWVAAGLDGFGTVMDTVATVSDPLGSAIAAGVGFILDHLDPLKSWLDDLTGDPGQVQANAGTYTNVAKGLSDEVDTLGKLVTRDLEDQSAELIDAYKAKMAGIQSSLAALANAAGATSTAMGIAGTIVQVVHDMVRDAISEIVGSAISYAAELIFTLGAATPLVIEQVSTRVADIAGRIGKDITGVVKSADSLKDLITKLDGAVKALVDDLKKIDIPGHVPGGKHAPDANAPKDPLEGSGLTPEKSDEIIATEKGSRPDPSTYLSPEYIEQHLHKFDGGATRFMTENNLQKYGIAQRDGSSFVMPKSEVDDLIRRTNGDPRAMEQALGLPEHFFDSGAVRVDIPSPGQHGLRMPSGNEAGANDQWMPGGMLPGDFSEAVIDGKDIPSTGYQVSGVNSSKGTP